MTEVYVVLYRIDGDVEYEICKDIHTALRMARKLKRCINVDDVVVVKCIGGDG